MILNRIFRNMKMMKNKPIFWLLALLLSGFTACTSVKPWQRQYLNDSAMQFGGKGVASFENSVQAIREGASSGETKSTGGCGCN